MDTENVILMAIFFVLGMIVVNLYIIFADSIFYSGGIFMLPSVQKEMQVMWSESVQTGNESGRCFTVEGNIIIDMWRVNYTSTSGLIYIDCKGAEKIHTHPNGMCALSPSDIYDFGFNHQQYDGVMCGRNRIVIYKVPNIPLMPLVAEVKYAEG
jgi:hypothetical protein